MSPPSGPKGPPAGAPEALVLHDNLLLLEAGDPALLAEVRADRRIGPLLPAQVSETVAAGRPGDWPALLAALGRAGHTPKVLPSG